MLRTSDEGEEAEKSTHARLPSNRSAIPEDATSPRAKW
jgi:hypothetical protein